MIPVALTQSPRLRYFTFFYLYLMQGIPAGFALTAMVNYLTSRGVSQTSVGQFIVIVGVPWTLQVLWGPVIDKFRLSKIQSRKHWIVFAQWMAVLASGALITISDPVTEIRTVAFMFMAHSIFASLQDASVDALAITLAPVHERGRVNGFMRGGFLAGIALGGAFLSLTLNRYGFRTAAMLQSGVLTLFSLLFLVTRTMPRSSQATIPDQVSTPTAARSSLKQVFSEIFRNITSARSLRYFTIVLMIYFVISLFIRSFVFFLINKLNWSDESVSVLQGGFGIIVTIIAILIAGIIADKIGPGRMQFFVLSGICAFLFLVSFFAIQGENNLLLKISLVVWNFTDPFLSVCVFPILMGLCSERVAASQFTAYMSLINLADVCGSYVAGWLLAYTSTFLIALLCGLLMLLLLALLFARRNHKIIPG
ncbi:MAG: MFS transporter [Flavitalea sp.]